MTIDRLFDKTITHHADAAFLVRQELPLLLKLSTRIRKYKKENGSGNLKIAVLGSYSIQHFTMMLDAFLMGAGIDAEFYEGEYDGIKMDVLNDDSPFYRFVPDMTLILTDHRDIPAAPSYLEDKGAVDALIKETADSIRSLWEKIRKRLPGCQSSGKHQGAGER